MSQVRLLNVDIDNLTMTEVLERLTSGTVITPNVDHLVKLQTDREFYDAYRAADFRTCDSKILYYVTKLLGCPVKEKISGSDLFPAFYKYHKHNEDIEIFLLGAKEGVAAEAQRRINGRIGRKIVTAVHSPSFGFEKSEEECERIIELVNQSKATVLAVGVGAPKQEKFIHKYKHRFKHVKIFMAIGATIDFEAGNVMRAPKWVSEMGLEWLYRLLSEPRRLWRRYLVEGPVFFWLAFLQMLRLYKDPFDADKPKASQATRITA
ncbi:WecB/TagA/CpsF family glycosyltransferase [Leptolyngbya ohadii]|uniref:WecB/TagA/CpsF family glycosyltransferase n=1 Tax=Leptolyngbya ohadii TaxID=1962290 RepID=UPI000B5A1F8C|nr:WecB/TagA/CpsF family glycosyltransferase [Leptolyngbya ohadii]